jgi:hypothetical protein
MAFQSKGFIDGKKTAMIYQTTDTIEVCSANDYFERCQVGNLIVILCSNGEKMGIVRLSGTHTVLKVF